MHIRRVLNALFVSMTLCLAFAQNQAQSPTHAESVDAFLARLPGVLDRVSPCRNNNAETCILAMDYMRELPYLKHVMNMCANLSPELAQKLPVEYQKQQLPECFGGIRYLTPEARSDLIPQERWLGYEMEGDYPSGKGFLLTVYIGSLRSGANRTVATALIEQHHSTPEQVQRSIAMLPPGSLTAPTGGRDARQPGSGPCPAGLNDFVASPREASTGQNVTFSYCVGLPQGETLARNELWMADDVFGRPGTWKKMDSTSLSGQGAVKVQLQYIPTKPGTYWFGVHAITATNREAHELAPLKVTVRP